MPGTILSLLFKVMAMTAISTKTRKAIRRAFVTGNDPIEKTFSALREMFNIIPPHSARHALNASTCPSYVSMAVLVSAASALYCAARLL